MCTLTLRALDVNAAVFALNEYAHSLRLIRTHTSELDVYVNLAHLVYTRISCT